MLQPPFLATGVLLCDLRGWVLLVGHLLPHDIIAPPPSTRRTIQGAEERETANVTSKRDRVNVMVAASGKMVLLDKLLPKLQAEGARPVDLLACQRRHERLTVNRRPVVTYHVGISCPPMQRRPPRTHFLSIQDAPDAAGGPAAGARVCLRTHRWLRPW